MTRHTRYNSKLFTKVRLVLCCLFTFFCFPAFASEQTSQTDQELLTQLEQAKPQDKVEVLLQLAVNNRSQNPHDTLRYGQQALELLKTHPHRDNEILILSNMGWSYMIVGDYDKGVVLAERGVTLAEGGEDDKALIVPLNIAGLLYWRQGRYEEALQFYYRALDVTKDSDDLKGQAATLNNIGLIHIEQGASPKAFDYFNRAKELFEKAGKRHAMTTAMNNIAGIHSAQSNYSQALEVQLEVLRVREELGDEPGIAEMLLNIGITYDLIGDYEKAHDYFSRAIRYFEPLGDSRAIAQTLNATGLAYFHQKEHEKAAWHYEKALSYAKSTSDRLVEAGVLLSLAQLHLALEEVAPAQSYLDQALELTEELGLKQSEAQARYHQAEIYLLQGLYEEALREVLQSIQISEETKNKAEESKSYELLSRIYQAQEQYQLALQAFRKHKAINDQVFSEETRDKLAQAQSLFEAEKRNKQIEILERDKALQKTKIEQQRFERNVWIASLLFTLVVILLLYSRFSQRKVNKALSNHLGIQRSLMQAIAHEFRAPLAKVQLAADMLEESDDVNDKKLFSTIHKGTSQLDSLLKEIIELLKMESLKELEPVEPTLLDDLIHDQVLAYQPLYPEKSIKLLSSGGEQQFELPQKHFTWILSNLLSNAAHYSLSQVEIHYSNSHSALKVSVDDDGIGIPKDDRDKVFEPFVRLDPSRTRSTGGTGLGLAIVQRLAHLYNAKVSISDSPLGGSRFTLQWPLK